MISLKLRFDLVRLAMKDNKVNRYNDLLVTGNLLVVAHAETMELAQQYSQILEDNGIPSKVKSRANFDTAFGAAIEVPEEYYDEAHMVIESHQDTNSFYDFFFDDPNSIDDEGFEFDERDYF